MSELRVTVEKVSKVEKHPDADRLDIIQVLGWNCVVGRDTIQLDDLVVYFPIDVILPEKLIELLFSESKIKPSNGRIKTIKIRGVVSQGLAIPVKTISVHYPDIKFKEGNNIADKLGIKKYEPKPTNPNKGFAIGQTVKKIHDNPNFVKYTDINHGKNYPNALKGEVIVITSKIHGCLDYFTEVETLEYGILFIGDIVKENIFCHVKSFDIYENKIVFNKIKDFSLQNNINNWYEIEMENGKTLKITEDHKIYLPELKCYRKVKDLKINDILLID